MGGIATSNRLARGFALALLLLLAPAAAGAADTDGDGVADGADNCSELPNPDQRDTNADGFGNACDPDFDQDGVVGWSDRAAVEQAFGASVGDARYDPDLDLGGNGAIGSHERLETARRHGSAPGPSGLACAGVAPCRAGLVWIDLVEEVLSRSVRLSWRAASPEVAFEVWRRAVGGAFGPVGRVGGSRTSFVDRGATGQGLAPGTYEYRVRGGGPWSDSRRVSIPEECAGQPATSALLGVVEIVDHEPDGDHDGEDVAHALAECSRQRGCVLRGLPVTYEDVNVQLASGSRYDFSRGLVIEGYGSATVFRSRLYSARDHDPIVCEPGAEPPCYVPRPVFAIESPGAMVFDGVRFRNFRIEGRKREQPDPGVPWSQWPHWGIFVSDPQSTDGGCVHHVTASGLLHGGFGVTGGNGWIFEDNTVRDVGCQDDLTPCDALERTPEYLSIPGVQQPGHGIVTGALTDGTVVRNNRVVATTKYAIAAVFGATRFHFHHNLVESNGGAGIQCQSCDTGLIEHNFVRSMHYPTLRNASWPDGYRGEVAQGLQCSGSGRNVVYRDNLVLDGDGTGIRLHCTGPDVLVEGNAVVGNCRRYGYSVLVSDGEGAVLRGNTLRDHARGCGWSVLVNRARNVRIEDTTIESGPGTLVGLIAVGTAEQPVTGLVLRNLRFTGRGSPGVGVLLGSNTSGTTVYDSTCSSGYETPFLDASAGGTLHPADPAAACPF
jgi:hypothetical protein